MTYRNDPRRVFFGAFAAIFFAMFLPGISRFARAADAPTALVAQAAAQMDATLGGLVRDGRSSFAAGIFVEDGAVTFARSYGVEGPGSSNPFALDSTFIDLNSIVKIFTAVAVAQLIEHGNITSIDDPINRYLKHFKLPLAFWSRSDHSCHRHA